MNKSLTWLLTKFVFVSALLLATTGIANAQFLHRNLAPPTNFVAVPGNDEVTLSWTTLTDDGRYTYRIWGGGSEAVVFTTVESQYCIAFNVLRPLQESEFPRQLLNNSTINKNREQTTTDRKNETSEESESNG